MLTSFLRCVKILLRVAVVLLAYARVPKLGWAQAPVFGPTASAGSTIPTAVHPNGIEHGGPNQKHTQSQTALDSDPSPGAMSIKKAFLNLPGDQKTIWTAPFRLRARDLPWLAPLGGVTGLLIATDQTNMR